MAETLWPVPNPDGSGRWSLYDSVAGQYVVGFINVPELMVRNAIGEHPAADWQAIAKANGWVSPDEVEAKIEAALDLAEDSGATESGNDTADAAGEKPEVQSSDRFSIDPDL